MIVPTIAAMIRIAATAIAAQTQPDRPDDEAAGATAAVEVVGATLLTGALVDTDADDVALGAGDPGAADSVTVAGDAAVVPATAGELTGAGGAIAASASSNLISPCTGCPSAETTR